MILPRLLVATQTSPVHNERKEPRMRLRITVTLEKEAHKDKTTPPRVSAEGIVDSERGLLGAFGTLSEVFRLVWEQFKTYETDFRRD